jgi:hypothetical protein
VRDVGGLGRLVRKLAPGRHQLRMRATDALGNRTKRPRVIDLRLLR